MNVISMLIAVITLSAPAPARLDRGQLEADVIAWARERVAQMEANDRVGPAAEWNKHLRKGNYEWLAVSLAVHYALDKHINLGVKGNRRDTPVLDQNIARDRTRLARIGQYLTLINSN